MKRLLTLILPALALTAGAPLAADAAGYGAFALDYANGASGFSVGYPSQSSADQRALSECAQRGGQNCAIRNRFSSRCAAVAMADDRGRWARGLGHAESRAEAVDRALSECRTGGLSGCSLYSWFCG